MLKSFAWFLLNSPQRKWIGWQTIFTDLKGFFSRWFYKNNSETIWICVGTYNRSQMLLKHLIPSITASTGVKSFGLSIADCGSTDVLNLEQEIKNIWKGELVFSSINEPFFRANVFNHAIQQAPGNMIFVCDADISLPQNIEFLIRKNVNKNSAWFPICQWQISEENKAWKWFTAGTGLFAATKIQLEKTGMYDAEIKTWGKEDWDLFFRFYKAGICPVRSRVNGLYHHWHKSLKPDNYTNLF